MPVVVAHVDKSFKNSLRTHAIAAANTQCENSVKSSALFELLKADIVSALRLRSRYSLLRRSRSEPRARLFYYKLAFGRAMCALLIWN